MRAQTITILGLNRKTVSVAKALKATPGGFTIIGYDRSRDAAQKVKDEISAIDRVEWNLVSAAVAADILVLSIPLVDLESILLAIGKEVRPHTLVIDLAPLKGYGLRLAGRHLKNGHYVGVVPVLSTQYLHDGREDISVASADLFRNSVFCLMPSPEADPQAVETTVNFGRLLGATPYFVDPMEYDNLAQGIETMPGILAAALFSALQKSTGWRDMLRFANGPFALATQSLRQGIDITSLAFNDKAAALRWLDAIQEELANMRRMIDEGDRELIDLTLGNLLLQRENWLKDREENSWAEMKSSPIEASGIDEQLLGGWLSGKLKGKGDK